MEYLGAGVGQPFSPFNTEQRYIAVDLRKNA